MTAQFLGYQHWNKYRNDFVIGITSEVDHDFKRLDTLERELDNIYDEDGLIIQRRQTLDVKDATRFDIMLNDLKAEAAAWVEKNGEISSQWLATYGARTADYDSAEAYVKDVERKIDRLVERDDQSWEWEWECFVEGLQYMLDEMIEGAIRRNPDVTGKMYIRVAARNIDWRGRSGALFCLPDAKTLLQKITGSHNSPSYHFYWGEQVGVTDDYGNVAMFSDKKFLHMVMPHHDAVTHADIEVVWDGTDANSCNSTDIEDMIVEDDLPAAKKICAALQSIARRIYGEDRHDRMFGERTVRPRIYNMIGFSSYSFADTGGVVLSEQAAAAIIDQLTSDLWFWVRQNYDENAETRRFCDELVHRDCSFHAVAANVEAFRDAYITAIEMIERDDINSDNNE